MCRKKKFKTSYSQMKAKKQIKNQLAAIQNTANSDVPTVDPVSQGSAEYPRVPNGGEGSEETRIPAGQSAAMTIEYSDDDNAETCIPTEAPIPHIAPAEHKDFDMKPNIFLFVQQNIHNMRTQSIVITRLTRLYNYWLSSTTDMNYMSRCLSYVEHAYGEFAKLQTITFNIPHLFNIMTLYHLKQEQHRLQQKVDYVHDQYLMVDHEYHMHQGETLELFEIFDLFRLDAEDKRIGVGKLFKEVDELDKAWRQFLITIPNDFDRDTCRQYNKVYREWMDTFNRKEELTIITYQIAQIYVGNLSNKLLPIKYMLSSINFSLDIARGKLISFKSKCCKLRILRSEFLNRQGLRHLETEILTFADTAMKVNAINIISPEDFRELVEKVNNSKPKLSPTETVKVPVQTTDAMTSTTSMETNIIIPPSIIHANTIHIHDSLTCFYISDDRCATPPHITEYDQKSFSPTDIVVKSHRGTSPMIDFMNSGQKSDDYKISEQVPDLKKKQDYAPEAKKSHSIPAIDLANQGSSNLLYEPDGDESPIDEQSTPIVFENSDDDSDTLIPSRQSSQDTLIYDFGNIDEHCANSVGNSNVSSDESISSITSSDFRFLQRKFFSNKSETPHTQRTKSRKQKLRSRLTLTPEGIREYAPEVKSGHTVSQRSRKNKRNKSHKYNFINNASIFNIKNISPAKQLPDSKESEMPNTNKSKIKRRKSCKQELRSSPPAIAESIVDYAPEVKSGHKAAGKGRKKKQNKSHKNNGNESITNMNPLSNNKALDDNKHEIDLSQAEPSDKKSINKNLAAGINLSVGKPNEHISIKAEFTSISIDEEIAHGLDFSMPEADILEAPYFETIANGSLVQYTPIQSVTASSANAYMNNIKNNSKEAHEQGQLQNQSTDDELIVHFTPEYFNEHEKQDIPKNKGKRTRGIKTKSILHRKPELVEEIQHNEVEPVELAAGDHKDKDGESIDKDQYPNQSVENEQMCPETKKQEDKEAIVKATVEVRDRLAETLSLLMTADFNLEEFILEHLTSDDKLNEFLGREEPISAHEVAILFLKHFQDTISQHKQPTQRKLENLIVETVEENNSQTQANMNKVVPKYKKKPKKIQALEVAITETIVSAVATEEKLQIKVLTAKDTESQNIEQKNDKLNKPTSPTQADTNRVVLTYKKKPQKMQALEVALTEKVISSVATEEKLQINVPTAIEPIVAKNQSCRIDLEPLSVKELADTVYGPSEKHANRHLKLIKLLMKEQKKFALVAAKQNSRQAYKTPLETRHPKRKSLHNRNPGTIDDPQLPELDKRSELVRKIKHKSSKELHNIKPTVKVEANTSQSEPGSVATENQIEEVTIDKRRKKIIRFKNSSVVTQQFKPDQAILEVHPSELNEPTICTKEQEIEHKPKLEPHQVEINDMQAAIEPAPTTHMNYRITDTNLDPPAPKVKVKRRTTLQSETARSILGTQIKKTPISEDTTDAEPTSAIMNHRHKRLGKFTNPVLSTRSLRILEQRKVHAYIQPDKEVKQEVTEKQKKDTKNREINNKKGKGFKFMKIGKQK